MKNIKEKTREKKTSKRCKANKSQVLLSTCKRQKHPKTIIEMLKFSYSVEASLPAPLHLPWATWIFRAVVRVNTAPQIGHSAFATTPDFSRWCLKRLLKVENSRPLQPWSQHCGRGLEVIKRTSLSGPGADSD